MDLTSVECLVLLPYSLPIPPALILAVLTFPVPFPPPQIYGSSVELAERLRDPARPGWLLEGETGAGGKPFLPFDNYSLVECATGW